MNVLFDLDGTLTDPHDGITASIEHALRKLGVSSPPRHALKRFIGPPLRDTFAHLLGGARVASTDPALIDAAITFYRERFSTTGLFENVPYPGIHATLSVLEQRGAALYLATSKPRVYAERIVDHFGLGKFLTAVHGSELDGTRTDKVLLIAHILLTESLSASATAMVGDRSHDVVGAVANGVLPVGALWGYGSRDELVAAGATVLCERPELLADTLL